ncbi:hypothetical protein ACTA71_007996 [Dictyostelium dimigraforme]
MKIFMIFILLIIVNSINSFDIDSIDPSHWESDQGFQYNKCSSNKINGYYTEFILSSYNTFYPTPYGFIPVSLYEGGVISACFKSQQVYSNFTLVGGNLTTSGTYWGYGSNSTQYVLINGTCTANSISYPFPPSAPKFKKVGETKIGQVDVDMVIMKNQSGYSNLTKTSVLIQKDTCIPMSVNIGNVDKSIKGYSLMNFYKFEDKPHKELFQLPQECWDIPLTTSTHSFTIKKNNVIKNDYKDENQKQKQVLPFSIHFHRLF